jgi:hypothetical protein
MLAASHFWLVSPLAAIVVSASRFDFSEMQCIRQRLVEKGRGGMGDGETEYFGDAY